MLGKVNWESCLQELEIPATEPARAGDSDNRDCGPEQLLRPETQAGSERDSEAAGDLASLENAGETRAWQAKGCQCHSQHSMRLGQHGRCTVVAWRSRWLMLRLVTLHLTRTRSYGCLGGQARRPGVRSLRSRYWHSDSDVGGHSGGHGHWS